jgi:hypothetical protein
LPPDLADDASGRGNARRAGGGAGPSVGGLQRRPGRAAVCTLRRNGALASGVLRLPRDRSFARGYRHRDQAERPNSAPIAA